MKILCLFWSNPVLYPLIREELRIFKKKSFNTVFISRKNKDLFHQNFLEKHSNSYRIFGSNNYIIDKIFFLYFLLFSFLKFIFFQPNIVILYGKHSLILVYLIKLIYKEKIIYHNFDYNLEKSSKINLFKKFINYSELYLSRHISLLIFSHPKRAEIFSKNSKIKKKKIIFMYNSFSLSKIKFKKKTSQILIWTGSIGPGHSLLNIVKSIKHMNKNIKLKIYGKIQNLHFFLKLKKIIESLNLKDRIEIKTSVSQKNINSQLIKSKVGLAIYEPVNLSHKYMAGASAKINEYLSKGLPIIVSNSKDFIFFSKKYKASIPVNIKKPLSIAKGISHILQNEKIYKNMSINAYNAFRQEFNFQNQFRKIQHLFIK